MEKSPDAGKRARIEQRVERIIEPASTLCRRGCGAMTKIGEDVSKRLDVIPAQWRVLVTRRPKYVCSRAALLPTSPAPLDARSTPLAFLPKAPSGVRSRRAASRCSCAMSNTSSPPAPCVTRLRVILQQLSSGLWTPRFLRADQPPIQALEQRREHRRRYPHHASAIVGHTNLQPSRRL